MPTSSSVAPPAGVPPLFPEPNESPAPLGVAPSFVDLGVPPHMAEAMAERGVTAPFPIQVATIPDGLAGLDLCGRAPTGSGKTIAFGIPMVMGVKKASPKRPTGLILVPTRELASQVAHELQLLAKPKGPWIEAFYGGVGFDRQISALQRGVDIAVGCPGRLADLINRRKLDLRNVSFVVIDEADRMADMGFLPEVRRLLDQCRPIEQRQTVLFSATLDGDVDVLISKYQKNPVKHEFGSADDDHANSSKADHFFWTVDRTKRISMAASIIKAAGPTVLFCRTKRGADRVADQLGKFGIRAAAIHGDRSQNARERALRQFHKGEVSVLVATDVAARGIHVDGVECVVHFDPPADPKDYVHRSGRTARAGNNGLVVLLAAPEQAKDVAKLQRALGYEQTLTEANPALLGDGSVHTAAAASRAPESTRNDRPDRTSSNRTSSNRTSSNRPARSERQDRPDRIAQATVDREVAALSEAAELRRPSGASRRKAKKAHRADAAHVRRDERPTRTDSRPTSDRSDNRPSSTRTDSRPSSTRTDSRSSGAPSGRPSTSRPANGRPSTSRPNGSRPGSPGSRSTASRPNGSRPGSPGVRGSGRPGSRAARAGKA